MPYDEFPFGNGLSVNELFDASMECRHGRCPFDTTPPCGCFPQLETMDTGGRRVSLWDVTFTRAACAECGGCGEEWRLNMDGSRDMRFKVPIGVCEVCAGAGSVAA